MRAEHAYRDPPDRALPETLRQHDRRGARCRGAAPDAEPRAARARPSRILQRATAGRRSPRAARCARQRRPPATTHRPAERSPLGTQPLSDARHADGRGPGAWRRPTTGTPRYDRAVREPAALSRRVRACASSSRAAVVGAGVIVTLAIAGVFSSQRPAGRTGTHAEHAAAPRGSRLPRSSAASHAPASSVPEELARAAKLAPGQAAPGGRGRTRRKGGAGRQGRGAGRRRDHRRHAAPRGDTAGRRTTRPLATRQTPAASSATTRRQLRKRPPSDPRLALRAVAGGPARRPAPGGTPGALSGASGARVRDRRIPRPGATLRRRSTTEIRASARTSPRRSRRSAATRSRRSTTARWTSPRRTTSCAPRSFASSTSCPPAARSTTSPAT